MKKFLIFVFFAICGVFMMATAAPVSAARQGQEIYKFIPLIVGIGQSNMSGAYPMSAVTALPPALPSVKMLQYTNTFSWEWKNLQEPSSVWKGYAPNPETPGSETDKKHGRYGAGTQFMTRFIQIMQAQEGQSAWPRVDFLNCGFGGSSVSDWVPNVPGNYFNMCWEYISNLLDNHTLMGIVVVNGETDTKNTTYSTVYKQNFIAMYEGIRARIIDRPNIPLVLTKLGDTPSIINSDPPILNTALYPQWDEIQADQVALVNMTQYKDYWNAVPAAGLPRQTDGITNPATYDLHYTKNGYDMLGNRLACSLTHILLGHLDISCKYP